jgi:hypothetical protein
VSSDGGPGRGFVCLPIGIGFAIQSTKTLTVISIEGVESIQAKEPVRPHS